MSALRVTDFLGNEYGIGDLVCYATVSGKSPVLKFARVEKIDEQVKRGWSWNDEEKKSYPTERVVKRVGVREIRNARGFTRWDSYTWDSATSARTPTKVRVTYPMTENIIKVTPAEGIAGA